MQHIGFILYDIRRRRVLDDCVSLPLIPSERVSLILLVHQGNGCGMEGADVGGTAGVGNYASRYAHGYGVFVESGCDDSSDSDNGSVVNVDVANDFHAVGQTNPMSDSGVVKNMVLNVMGQSHKNSDRNVAVDAYTAVWIDNNRAVVAYHQPRSYVCLPRNLEAVFDRVVPQGYAA